MLDIIVVLLLVYVVATLPYVVIGIKVSIACKRSALSKIYIEGALKNSYIYRD